MPWVCGAAGAEQVRLQRLCAQHEHSTRAQRGAAAQAGKWSCMGRRFKCFPSLATHLSDNTTRVAVGVLQLLSREDVRRRYARFGAI